VPEHHVIQYYSKNRGKTPGIPALHRRSRYVVNFTFLPLYPRHTLDRNVRRHFDRTGICDQEKIPTSTECRTPVARPVTATSLSELPASYHNLHQLVKNKSSNSVATLTINLFLYLVIRLPSGTYCQQKCHCEAVERIIIFFMGLHHRPLLTEPLTFVVYIISEIVNLLYS